MQRPDKIKIGYRNYKLEEWKQTVASANEAQGQFFAKEGVIGYTAEETGVSHANTLIHEILHAIVYQWNMELEEKDEEKLVNGLANGLTTIFVDNPKKLFSISSMYWRLENIASIPVSLIANPAGFQNAASIPVAEAAAPPPDKYLAPGTTNN